MIVIDIKNNKIIKMIFLIKLEMKLNDLNDNYSNEKELFEKNKIEKSRIKIQKNEYDNFENGNDTKRIKDLLFIIFTLLLFNILHYILSNSYIFFLIYS